MEQIINVFGVFSLSVIIVFVAAHLPDVAARGFKALTPFGRYVFGVAAVVFAAASLASLLVGCAADMDAEIHQSEIGLEREMCVDKCWDLHPGDPDGVGACIDAECPPPTRTECRGECKDSCYVRQGLRGSELVTCFESCEESCPSDGIYRFPADMRVIR